MRSPESSVRDIPLWVRRYAQNRSVPMLLSLCVFAVLFAGISGFSYLAGSAYRARQYGQFAWLLAVDLIFVVADVYVSVPRFGGRWVAQFCERLGTQEGRVELLSARPRRALRWIGIVFVLCVLGSVIGGNSGLISPHLMQPVTALYVVPFLTVVVLLQRPRSSYLWLIWPALYTAHAISLLAGAPAFTGHWDALNCLLPTFGYGLLTAIIAQIYSSYALSRLKRLAKVDGPAEGSANA